LSVSEFAFFSELRIRICRKRNPVSVIVGLYTTSVDA